MSPYVCTSTAYGYSLCIVIIRDIRREIRSDFAWFSFPIRKKKLCKMDGTEWLLPLSKNHGHPSVILLTSYDPS